MKIKVIVMTGSLALISVVCGAASPSRKSASETPIAHNDADSEAIRLEGEQRFQANCGRCHAPPHKFPPRMMATIVRHMRVRATITDEDMRVILYYMTR
jgi:mono/diheme cytochrome c family protein